MLVYGSKQCPDTVACLSALHAAGTPYEFRDLAALSALKEFLKYRDTLSLFDPVKAKGGVGIPLPVREDGTFTFEWTE